MSAPSDGARADARKARQEIAEAEQRGREDNADHSMCYVHGSAALADLIADAKAEAWDEGVIAGARCRNSVIWDLNPHRAVTE